MLRKSDDIEYFGNRIIEKTTEIIEIVKLGCSYQEIRIESSFKTRSIIKIGSTKFNYRPS